MDLIVLADQDGIVDMTYESIARVTNRPLDIIRKTIAELEGPDAKSRTADHNGARLKRLDDHRDWGWVIINFMTFRGIATDSQYREKNRLRAQKFREKHPYQPKVTLRPLAERCTNVRPASASASVPASGVRGVGEGVPIPVRDRIAWEHELDRVEKRLEVVLQQGTQCAGSRMTYSTPQRAEIKTLKDRREELKKALGYVA